MIYLTQSHTLSFKILRSVGFSRKKFIFEDTLNCSKLTVKTVIMFKNSYISNKCYLFKLPINQRILKNN